MIFALMMVPLLAAAVAYAVPSNRWRPLTLPAGSLAHLILVGDALWSPPPSELSGWLMLDPLGKLVLGLISVVFSLLVSQIASGDASLSCAASPGITACAGSWPPAPRRNHATVSAARWAGEMKTTSNGSVNVRPTSSACARPAAESASAAGSRFACRRTSSVRTGHLPRAFV